MHISRLIIILGVIAIVIGCVLPWASIGDLISVSGIDGSDGYIAIGLGIVALVLGVIGDRSTGLGAGKGIGVVVLCLLAAGVAFLNLTKFEEGIDAGIGIYLTLVGGVVGAVGGFLGLKR